MPRLTVSFLFPCKQEEALTGEAGMKGLLPLLLNFIALSSAFPPERKDTNDGLRQLAQVGSLRMLLATDNKMFRV